MENRKDYLNPAEQITWGCLCKGAGTCVVCLIRKLIQQNYGVQGIEIMEKRLWPQMLKAKVLKMGPEAGSVLIVTSSESISQQSLEEFRSIVDRVAAVYEAWRELTEARVGHKLPNIEAFDLSNSSTVVET